MELRTNSFGSLARFIIFSSLIGAALSVSCASASDLTWRAALGAGVRPDYEGGDDYEAVPIGALKVKWNENAFVELAGAHGSGGAPRLRVNLVSDAFLQFGPVLQYRLGRKDVHDDRVDALPDVDPTPEAGAFMGFEDETGWTGAVTFVNDIGGEHDGFLFELMAGYGREVAPGLTLGASVASTYASDGYMGAFFTVDADDAPAAGLPPFDADKGFRDVGGQLKAEWMFPGIEHFGLSAVFSYFHLLEDAENSPIVDEAGDADQLFGGLMLVYRS